MILEVLRRSFFDTTGAFADNVSFLTNDATWLILSSLKTGFYERLNNSVHGIRLFGKHHMRSAFYNI